MVANEKIEFILEFWFRKNRNQKCWSRKSIFQVIVCPQGILCRRLKKIDVCLSDLRSCVRPSGPILELFLDWNPFDSSILVAQKRRQNDKRVTLFVRSEQKVIIIWVTFMTSRTWPQPSCERDQITFPAGGLALQYARRWLIETFKSTSENGKRIILCPFLMSRVL